MERTSIIWDGHANYVIRSGGLTVRVDPVWSEAIPGRIRRLGPPGIGWDELPPIDAALISHNHGHTP